MKLIKYALIGVLLIAASVFIVGCASAPEEPETEQTETAAAQEETTAPEAEEQEPEPEEVIVITDLPVRRNSYFADGTLDEYTVYTYQGESAELLSEELYSSKDELTERRVFTYENGMITRQDIQDAAGKLQSYYLYTYDADGNLLTEETYDNEDELQLRSEYEYDGEGNKVKWTVYGGNEAMLSYTEYTWENGINTRTETYTPSGALDVYFEYEYNDEGMKVKSSQHEADGDLMEYRVFTYENGFPVEMVIHRKNGSVLRKVGYKNNERGNPEEIIYLNSSDKVQERITIEYTQLETVEYINR